jgi:hypothetical protein
VSDWTGVIFRGTSERQQEVDGKDITFFFKGDSIKRSGRDILVLENGTISSHDAEDPDFSLRAKKIWITGPGEWGLFNATLYVGHIPVFYLPFYWKSGSDLLFNPVIGVRNRVGYYIQSTTYLAGEKEYDDGFSIMGFGDSAGPGYELTRDGLFLVRGGTADSEGAASPNTLKYMLDVYTSLGAMTGFQGSYPNIGKKGSLDFYATLGFSRIVDSSGYPYFNDGSSPRTYWNDSYIGVHSIPFRWGTSLVGEWGAWSVSADWYSDPYYLQDFGDRKESFDWLSFLLSEEESGTDSTDLITGLKWEIRGSGSYTPEKLSPWINSLSMDGFRASLNWQSKPNLDIPQPLGADALDPLAATYRNQFDPARDFYYPETLILPDLKLSMSGSSPTWRLDRFEAPEQIDGAPDEAPGKPGDDQTIAEAPPYDESLSAVYDAGLLDARLSYRLRTQLYIEDQSDSEAWDSPAEINFDFQAARINTTQSGDLLYDLALWDGLTGMNGATRLSGYYQAHAGIFGSDSSVDDTTRLEDYKYSKFLWDNSISLYLKPLQGVPTMEQSSLNYSIDANVYTYNLADGSTVDDREYIGSWISGEDDFNRHEASATAIWKPGYFSVTSGISGNIPPLSQRYSISTGAGYARSGWTADVSQQTVYENGAWNPQPIVMSGSWTGWKDEVTVSQTARYDTDRVRWVSAESLFGFWGFETKFVANYGTTYTWSGTTWTEDPDESFAPSSLTFAYRREFNPKPVWKNRIRTNTRLDTSWNINLRQPTENVLGFKWTQVLFIHQFLDLEISFSSTNKSMYLYFPKWRNQLGIPNESNFFQDLMKSFNVFNPEDRRQSQFNMDRIDVSLVHHLRSWDLTVEYSGWPALNSTADGYFWKSELDVFMKWNALPMFNQRTKLQDSFWSVDSFEQDS